jgi:hypothetical protein
MIVVKIFETFLQISIFVAAFFFFMSGLYFCYKFSGDYGIPYNISVGFVIFLWANVVHSFMYSRNTAIILKDALNETDGLPDLG